MKKLKKISATLATLSLFFALASCSNGKANNKTVKNKTKNSSLNDEFPTESPFYSLTALDNFKGVYSFDYNGYYNLNAVMNKNITTLDDLKDYLSENIPAWITAKANGVEFTTQEMKAACTSIVSARNDPQGGQIFGRNFDYTTPKDSILIVHTYPTDGYESISTCFPIFLADFENWAPIYDNSDLANANNAVAIGSIFAPMDGMNSQGFYISILEAGDEEPTAQTKDNAHAAITSVAVRYLLDHADSVDKALELLENNINMHSVFNTAYHFAMADASGNAVVVEYINNKMISTKTKVVTNHYIGNFANKPVQNDETHTADRYEIAQNAGEAAQWNMTHEQVRAVLNETRYSQYDKDDTLKTVWSIIYEPTDNKITYYFREDYNNPAIFTLGNK